jgi:hypothetical protein
LTVNREQKIIDFKKYNVIAKLFKYKSKCAKAEAIPDACWDCFGNATIISHGNFLTMMHFKMNN